MKRIFLALAAVLVLSATAQAQCDKKKSCGELSEKEHVQMRTDRMAKHLSLDDSQKEALLKLNTQFAAQAGKKDDCCKATEKKSDCSKSTDKKSKCDSKGAYKAELKKILTAEQYAKFEKLKKENKKENKKSNKKKDCGSCGHKK